MTENARDELLARAAARGRRTEAEQPAFGRAGRYMPPPRRKGPLPGQKVRCPWCGRPGVDITRRGLAKHAEDDSPSTCEGWGKQVVLGENGRIEKA